MLQNLLRHWPIGRKFALVAVVSLSMAAVPAVLLIGRLLHHYQAARTELAGIAPADAALKALRVTQQHRGLSAVVLSGQAAQRDARAAKAQEVQAAFERLRVSVVPLHAPVVAGQATALQRDWTALAQALESGSIDAPESFRRHSALIANELLLLTDVADASGISLDPEGETYYLAQAVLAALPRLTERMGQARARGATLLAHGGGTPEERATLAMLNEQGRLHAEEAADRFAKMARHDPSMGRALAQPMEEAMAAAAGMVKVVDGMLQAGDTQTLGVADYFADSTRRIDAQFTLIGRAFGSLSQALERRQAEALQQVAGVGVAMLLLALAGAAILWAVARGTTRSIAQAVQVARAVAAGDLASSIDVTGRDEVGQLLAALAQMNQRLVAVVGRVRDGSDGVATASVQIAQGNADLSGRTEAQASALQQTAATMEELGGAVRQNAGNAREADALAQGACTVAARGGEVVAQVVQTMQGIHTSSRRIADITSVIDGIAFQTNILALNAAVEAARAGEQGRGFAVVASEVRTLAQRSADAAREIKGLITASVEQVEAGSLLVGEAGTTMEEVVGAIRSVTTLMAEISSASSEQSTGVAQVGTAIAQMDSATQQNAALVEESAAAAESLRVQAHQLVEAVAVFRLA